MEDDLAFGRDGFKTIYHDFFSAILVAAVDHVNLGGDTGKIDGLFNCGVAAADDGNFLVAVEETVAGCAGGNAFALEFFFTGKTEILSAGAGSNNQSVASVVAVVADQTDRFFVQMSFGNFIENDSCFKTLSMFEHALHKFRTHHAFGVAGPVVDFSRCCQLTALLHTCNESRF